MGTGESLDFERQAGQHDPRTGKRTGVRWHHPSQGVTVVNSPARTCRSVRAPSAQKLNLKILRQLNFKITAGLAAQTTAGEV